MIEDGLGLDYSKPVPHMREYLTVLNGLLRGEQVKFAGELYRVNSQVGVVGAVAPPVIVAALGPAMLRLCGRLADGTITWMGGVNYLRDVAVPTMSEAARAAGRPAPRFVAMVPVLQCGSVLEGREVIDATFRMYGQIPSYKATLERGGASMPSDVAVVGDAGDIEAGVRAFREAGVTDFVAAVPRQDAGALGRTMETLARLAG
jgi:F420-dependent oxidoreductase-like protein